jgi:hypothetical protein
MIFKNAKDASKKNDQIHRVKNFLDNLIPRSPFKNVKNFINIAQIKKVKT